MVKNPNIRYPKEVTDKETIDILLNMTEEYGLKESSFMEIFGDYGKGPKCQPYDILTVPAGYYGPEGNKNTNTFRTTVGSWWFNKTFIEKDLFDIEGYVTDEITGDKFSDINQDIAYAVMEDKLDISVLKKFIMKCQKFQPYSTMLCPGYTMKMLLISKEIEPKKKELLKKYEKELAVGDSSSAKIASDIEKELLKYAKELLEGDPSADLYNSGARGSWGNNFKNLHVMKGAVKNPDPDKGYDIISSNLIDGVKKEEYVTAANSLVEGPYARGKKTEMGGAQEKLFLRAFQHLTLDPKGSDCGTKRTITITLDKKNIKDNMYNFVWWKNKWTEITSDNASQLIGQTVKMRFSSMCESKTGFCNMCAGNMFYRLGIKNIGTATPQIPSKLKNASMKSFHNSVVDFAEMDPMKAFSMK